MNINRYQQGRDKSRPYKGSNVGAQLIAPWRGFTHKEAGRDKSRPYNNRNVGAQFIAPCRLHIRAALLALVMLLALLALPGRAQQQPAATGLPLATYSLAFDNVLRGTLYAGTGDGVYKSGDGGKTWQQVGLAGSAVYAVLPDPRESNLLFAAAQGGIFVSSDGGNSWQPGLRLAPSLAAYALAADSSAKPAAILAAADGGVYISHDRGASWQLAGIDGQRPTSLAFDGVHGTAYAGDGFNLYRSDNGGAWQPVSGLVKATNSINGIAVNGLAVDSNAHVVYAATQRGLYKSADVGQNWIELGETARCDFIVLLIGSSRTLYASFNGRLKLSTDEGNSWNVIAAAPAAIVHAAILTPAGVTWFATGAGLLQQQGDALTPALSGDPPITAFAVGQVRSEGQLEEDDFAVAGGHLYRSSDHGQHWAAIPADLPAPVNAVLLSEGQLVAATASGLYASDNGGRTWLRSDTPACGAFTSLVLNPNQPTNLYAGCARGGVYGSKDRGLSWQPLAGLGLPATPADVAVDPTAPATLLAMLPAHPQATVYRSVDGGQHWRSAALALPADLAPVALVVAPQPAPRGLGLVASEPSPATLYLASADGRLLASADAGSTWQPLKLAPPAHYTDLRLVPGQPASLYLATSAGVYNSPDAGLSWQQVGSIPARQLAFIGAGADTRVVAVTGGGAPLLNLGNAVGAAPTITSSRAHPSDPAPPVFGAVNFPAPGSANALYFLETHHNLQGDFLRFWQKYDGLRVFGYPLTEEFAESGLKVQYFERVRLEYHAENVDQNIEPVVISRLGSQLTQGRYFIPARFFAPDPSRIYFAETQHSIQHGFYTYWQQHGGLDVFGYPISEEIKEGNYVVQWFERARFEYRPENAGTENEVQETQLGRQILRDRGWIGQG